MTRVHLDFETRSVVDLRRAGAYIYAVHPSTEVLCAGYSFDDGPVQLWTRGAAPPPDLTEAARDPRVQFHAFNVGFERRIWTHVLHKRLGWPDLPLERWYDTQADAYACALPGDLKRCAIALEVGVEKDATGTRLINRLCKPIGDTDQFREKKQFLQDFEQLYEYCRQDVKVERAIYHSLPEHTTARGEERALWLLTERINDRGVHIDRVFAQSIWTLIEVELKDMLCEQLIDLTDGRVTSGNQTQKMNSELTYPLGDFQQATLKKALTCPLLHDKDRTIIESRLAFANTSVAKYARMLDMVGPDDRVRDLLQYHGAATGRYAGRGIQVQNFPRSAHPQADRVSRDVTDPTNTLHTIEDKYGPIQELAKHMLRPTLCAAPGKTLVCRDYSSIEARGTAWATGDQDQLDAFAAGRDIYRVTAADMYNLRYEDIGKDSPERQAGKIAVLACLASDTEVLTDVGLVPIEKVCSCMRVWDGVEWVHHEGAIYQGYQEVMRYGELLATPEHQVYLEDGGTAGLREAARRGARIVTSGIGRTPVWVGESDPAGDESDPREPSDPGTMHRVPNGQMDQLGQFTSRKDCGLPRVLSTETGPSVATEAGTGGQESMRESEGPGVRELRSSGDRVSLLKRLRYGVVGYRESRAEQADGDRPDRQQRPLRAGESSIGEPSSELLEQTGIDGTSIPPIQDEIPECPLCGQHLKELHKARQDRRRDRGEMGTPELQAERRVWDLLNAGPRHRFTANGKLVSNCGYQGGWKALRDFAAGYGVHWTPHQANRIVKDFRAARPRLVAAWQMFEQAAMEAISIDREVWVEGCTHCIMRPEGRHMSMELPSGRKLWFPYAEIRMVKLKYETPEGEIKLLEKDGFTHMWLNSSNQWVRRGLHGGSLFQSYVQAICRDIMTEGMLRQEKAGWDIVLSVHDEVAAEADELCDPASFEALMVQVPAWAEGFPIGAAGWEGQRYHK
jgi:DNA polymerase